MCVRASGSNLSNFIFLGQRAISLLSPVDFYFLVNETYFEFSYNPPDKTNFDHKRRNVKVA